MASNSQTTRPDSKFGQLLAVGHDYQYGGMDFRISFGNLTRVQLEQLIVMTHYALKEITDFWIRENQPKANTSDPYFAPRETDIPEFGGKKS